MNDTPVTMAMMEPPDPELIIKRLFKVAEILSRKPSHEQATACCRENDGKNRDACNIGYCEPKDRFSDT